MDGVREINCHSLPMAIKFNGYCHGLPMAIKFNGYCHRSYFKTVAIGFE